LTQNQLALLLRLPRAVHVSTGGFKGYIHYF
jgi:hypothetical protein